jgi:hypothetical protein
MKISRSLYLLIFAALFNVRAFSSAENENLLLRFSENNLHQSLGSCATERAPNSELSRIQGIYAYALLAGTLTYRSTQARSGDPTPYCAEMLNDRNCDGARAVINCITKPTGSARLALAKIAVLEKYFTPDGAYTYVQPTNAAGIPIGPLVPADLQEILNSLGTTLTGITAYTPTQAGVLFQEISAMDLKGKLTKEISELGGLYIGCMWEKIKASGNETQGCGAFANLENVPEGTDGTDRRDTIGGDSGGDNSIQAGSPTSLFIPGSTTGSSGPVVQSSRAAWTQAGSLATAHGSQPRMTAATSANSSRPLNGRIRTTFNARTASAVPMPIHRNVPGSTAPAATTDGTSSNSVSTPDGRLTDSQTRVNPAAAVATCFSSATTTNDLDFTYDKPAFKGPKTLHIYEMIHLGSEYVNTKNRPVMTSAFRALVPSTKMEDDKNKELKAAGDALVLRPFVRVRGYCPLGATAVTIGGSSAPRIVVNILTGAYQTANEVPCQTVTHPTDTDTAKIFTADLAFTGKPGTHFLEIKAAGIGPGGSQLVCKEEVAVIDKTGKTSYADYLTKADFMANSTLSHFARIQATQSASPLTGTQIPAPAPTDPLPNCFRIGNVCY